MFFLITLIFSSAFYTLPNQAMHKYAAPVPQDESMENPPPTYSQAIQNNNQTSAPTIVQTTTPNITNTIKSRLKNLWKKQYVKNYKKARAVDMGCCNPCCFPICIGCCLPLALLCSSPCQIGYVCCDCGCAKNYLKKANPDL